MPIKDNTVRTKGAKLPARNDVHMDARELLIEEATRAINAVFGDTSVSKDVTREALENLRADIDSMLDAL